MARVVATTGGVPTIWLLVALAFGVAFSNFMIGQRAILFHVQQPPHNDPSPTIERSQHRKITFNSQEQKEEKDDFYDGEYITQILLGNEPFPSNSDDINSSSSPSPRARLKYKPGTLHLTHADALQHCFVNVTHYSGHIQPQPQSLVSISHKYKLIYRNVVKSSSSSARHVMQDFLSGRDFRLKHADMTKKVQEEGYTMISFIREPLNRFYSSYDEAYFR